jgi:hypothetical protein
MKPILHSVRARAMHRIVQMQAQAESIINRVRSAHLDRDRASELFPTFRSMCIVTVYTFRVRDGGTGKWRDSRHKMTLEKAEDRYGPGNYEVLESSKEVRWRRLLGRIFRLAHSKHANSERRAT